MKKRFIFVLDYITTNINLMSAFKDEDVRGNEEGKSVVNASTCRSEYIFRTQAVYNRTYQTALLIAYYLYTLNFTHTCNICVCFD